MGLGLLLVPALAGYLFLRLSNSTRFDLYRETGHHVVFQSAIAGAILFFVSRIIVMVVNDCVSDVGDWWKDVLPMPYSGTAAGTFLVALMAVWVGNQLGRSNLLAAQQKAARRAGDQISLVIDQAIIEERFVELSLASGGFYVGRPFEGTFGQRDDGAVAIIPVVSGYRDEATQHLVIARNYAPAVDRLLASGKVGDARVAFPMREIVAARLFDLDDYIASLEGESTPHED